MTKVDTRGCSCPVPVLMTKKALAKDSELEVLVDNNTAKQNIERFAASQGAKVEILSTECVDEYILKIVK